jgi:hypothetical protein
MLRLHCPQFLDWPLLGFGIYYRVMMGWAKQDAIFVLVELTLGDRRISSWATLLWADDMSFFETAPFMAVWE